MDGLTFSGFMQRVKDACCGKDAAPKAGAAAAGGGDDAGEDDGPGASTKDAGAAGGDDTAACLAFECVENLAAALKAVGLRSNEDVRQLCAEVLPDLAACARVVKAGAAGRVAGLASGGAGRAPRFASAIFPRGGACCRKCICVTTL